MTEPETGPEPIYSSKRDVASRKGGDKQPQDPVSQTYNESESKSKFDRSKRQLGNIEAKPSQGESTPVDLDHANRHEIEGDASGILSLGNRNLVDLLRMADFQVFERSVLVDSDHDHGKTRRAERVLMSVQRPVRHGPMAERSRDRSNEALVLSGDAQGSTQTQASPSAEDNMLSGRRLPCCHAVRKAGPRKRDRGVVGNKNGDHEQAVGAVGIEGEADRSRVHRSQKVRSLS